MTAALCCLALCFLLPFHALAAETCRSGEDVIRYLKSRAASRPDTITFRFSDDLYGCIADEKWMGEVLPYAGILSAAWQYTKKECTLNRITYLEMIHCETEKDVLEALEMIGSSRAALHLSETLWERLSADSFAAFRLLQGQAGVGGDFRYYDAPQRVILTDNMKRAENFHTVSDAARLKALLYAQSEQLTPSVTVHLPEALFRRVTSGNDTFLNALENNCGIMDRELTYSAESRMLTYENIQYYPGKRLVSAARWGLFDKLTREEMILYNQAAEIINKAVAESHDALSYLQIIHDEIARRCTYQTSGKQKDTAAGALLYGGADCDGYADALYLLCNLAGLECHYQTGYGRDPEGRYSAHMWNGVNLGGRFYCTDVTWDDHDREYTLPYHAFMNMGEETVSAIYQWDREAAMFSVAPEDPSLSAYVQRGTAFDSLQAAQSYINRNASSGETLSLMLTEAGRDPEGTLQSLMDGVHTAGQYGYHSVDGKLYILFSAR